MTHNKLKNIKNYPYYRKNFILHFQIYNSRELSYFICSRCEFSLINISVLYITVNRSNFIFKKYIHVAHIEWWLSTLIVFRNFTHYVGAVALGFPLFLLILLIHYPLQPQLFNLLLLFFLYIHILRETI